MTAVDNERRAAIEAEARAWIVRLDGGPPSKEDLAALREWAGRSPVHLAALREMAQWWAALDVLSVVRDVAGAGSLQTDDRETRDRTTGP